MYQLKKTTAFLLSVSATLALGACTEFVDSLPDSGEATPSNQAELTWNSPESRTDGSCLNRQLAGYLVNYRSATTGEDKSAKLPVNSGELSCQQTTVNSCGEMNYSCSHTVTGLEKNTWTFAVQAYDTGDRIGPESEAVEILIQ